MNTKTTVSAARIKRVFGNGGQLNLLRHGKTNKKGGDQPDYTRTLTPEGERQARSTAEKLSGRTFDVIMASRANRARHTTCLVTGCSFEDIRGEVTSFVITDDKTTPLNQMFEKLMYSPLSEYHQHPDAEELHELGRNALNEILDLAEQVKSDGTAKVMVGGHAVYHPQVVYAIGEALETLGGHDGSIGTSLKDAATKVNLGEACVIVLNFGSNERGLTVEIDLVQPDPAPAAATTQQ